MALLPVALAALAAAARGQTSVGSGSVPWPLRAPFVVMNTIGTLQFYGDKPGFHHGVDLKAAAETKVYAPVSGAVGAGYYYPRYKSPYTFMVSIDADDGYRWELHHVDPASVPQAILDLAAVHGRVEAGTLLAAIFDTSTTPELGVPPHLHVDLIDPNGVRHDALQRFPPLSDDQAPEIRGVYFVGGDGRAAAGVSGLLRRETLAAGRYDLVVDALETVSPGTNGDVPYRMEVRAAGRLVGSFRFDRLPDADYLKGVADVYRLEPFAGLDGKQLQNQIAAEAPRRFLFRFPFDTASLGGPGLIPVEVRAYGLAGGETRAVLRLMVKP